MSCDIHIFLETKIQGKWNYFKKEVFQVPSWKNKENGKTNIPFDIQDYEMFALFADVRNYCDIKPISKPRGFPYYSCCKEAELEAKYWEGDAHSHSYLTLEDLLGYDYDSTYVDSRNENKVVSFRDSLSDRFFDDLEQLKKIKLSPKDIRIVFFFDN